MIYTGGTGLYMTEFIAVSQSVLQAGGYAVVVLLCLVGVAISCVSISGTWAVVLAAALACAIGNTFPGLWTVVAFVVISGLVEGVEALSGAWGVRSRGGSRLAGVAALIGGLLGLVLGGMIPIPFIGNLLGMILGGFALAFAVEYRRLRRADSAAHIATGAVVARLLVTLLKLLTTLGMSGYLLIGLLVSKA